MKPPVYSNAQSNNAMCIIETMENVQFKLYDFQLPMLSFNSTILGTDSKVQIRVPGTHVEFDFLQINFFVDELWENYFECYDWSMLTIGSPDPFEHTKTISIVPLDSNKNPVGRVFVFLDAHIMNMAPVQLDGEGETTDIVMGLTISFSEMKVEKWFDADGSTNVVISKD
ncbi:tail completion and sheath stabilizer protein [Acinetobacter phage SH-Ab 15599]|nr:tail completion and sheath stabilizer protein [Acinetobacter phage SH-Ab 15599]